MQTLRGFRNMSSDVVVMKLRNEHIAINHMHFYTELQCMSKYLNSECTDCDVSSAVWSHAGLPCWPRMPTKSWWMFTCALGPCFRKCGHCNSSFFWLMTQVVGCSFLFVIVWYEYNLRCQKIIHFVKQFHHGFECDYAFRQAYYTDVWWNPRMQQGLVLWM